MPNAFEKESPQRETQTEQTSTGSQWNIPTLADLLQRLSITSKPSQSNNGMARISNKKALDRSGLLITVLAVELVCRFSPTPV